MAAETINGREQIDEADADGDRSGVERRAWELWGRVCDDQDAAAALRLLVMFAGGVRFAPSHNVDHARAVGVCRNVVSWALPLADQLRSRV